MAGSAELVAERLRAAFARQDVAAFGELLADDVRWGDDTHPRRCRGRAEVVATFGRQLAAGVDGGITELAVRRAGIVCGLWFRRPAGPAGPATEALIYHLYLLRHGLISEIRRYNDRRSALQAADQPDD